jgi:hypothetical protein
MQRGGKAISVPHPPLHKGGKQSYKVDFLTAYG